MAKYFVLYFFSLLIANSNLEKNLQFDQSTIQEIREISTEKLLKYEQIALALPSEFEKTRFYYIIAYEIERRIKKIDKSFNHYVIKINEYEYKLNLYKHHIKIDLPSLHLIFEQNYSSIENLHQSKTKAKFASSIYKERIIYYSNYFNDYKKYYNALKKLYYSTDVDEFNQSLKYYYLTVKNINK
tara:strand:+ start:185 stop:739 length:555 start_codon:yes stop_codon:yes gene_type:complete